MQDGSTDFEFLPIDVSLARCFRYYYLHVSGASQIIGTGGYYSNTYIFMDIKLPVQMRTSPTLNIVTGTDYYIIYRNSGSDYINSLTVNSSQKNAVNLYNNSEASGTAGHAGFIETHNASAYLALDSEL